MERCSIINVITLLLLIVSHSIQDQSEKDSGENEDILQAKKRLRGIYPDVDLTAPELIRKEGYPCEIHHVQTRDGFIIELHRINLGTRGKSVLFQHAALQSSADVIINGRNNSIAYQLADNGYDVWLGNHRGNTYSYKHVNLTMKDRKYWDYSIHEMAIYDLRAIIDYILDLTKERDLYHIGHAWGSAQFFILTSLYPEYNDKIRLAIALAPAAFLGYWRSPLRFIAPIDILGLLVTTASYEAIGDERVRPDRVLNFVRSMTPGICRTDLIDDLVCNNFMFLLEGYDYSQRNDSNLPAILARTPTTVSSKSLLHMEQMILTNQFMQFNYGRRRNIKLYGQPNPPKYDFSKITTKVAIFWGPGDFMAAPKNVERIAEQIPNLVANHRVDHDTFNHYDFSYAIDAKTLVYDHCLRLIRMH